MTDWNEVREELDKTLQVYYTKRNPEVNIEREANKQKTIKWLIEQFKLGPALGGVITNDRELPDFCIWSSDVWEADKIVIRMRDPICRICGIRPTTEVHHIRPKHLKGAHYHPRNLIGLCTECHDEVHRYIDENITKICQDSLNVKIIDDAQKTLEGW